MGRRDNDSRSNKVASSRSVINVFLKRSKRVIPRLWSDIERSG